MHKKYDKTYIKDRNLSKSNPWYEDLPLEKCMCGGQPHFDVSMALIQCNNCGLCFEYRYGKPYYTWQAVRREQNPTPQNSSNPKNRPIWGGGAGSGGLVLVRNRYYVLATRIVPSPGLRWTKYPDHPPLKSVYLISTYLILDLFN